MNEKIDLQCLTRRNDLLAEEAQQVNENLGLTWTQRLAQLGDYGRAGGSAADRRQIIQTLALIEQRRLSITGSTRDALRILTDHCYILAREAKAKMAARERWDTPLIPDRSHIMLLRQVMAGIERGDITATLITDGNLGDRLRSIADDPKAIEALAREIGEANTAMDDDGSNDGEHYALRAIVDLISDQPVKAPYWQRLAQDEYDVLWKFTATGVNSPEEAARQAWRMMRNPDSIANVFEVTDRHGDEHEIDIAELDGHPDA